MEQLYLLSILSSAGAGLLLLLGGSGGTGFSFEEQANAPVIKEGFKLALGIACFAIGVLKIFLPISGMKFFGDLLPALAGMLSGFALIYGFYRSHSDIESVEPSALGVIIENYGKVAGFAAILIAAAHFLLPRLPLL